jgi:hypothetical protein
MINIEDTKILAMINNTNNTNGCRNGLIGSIL